MLKNWEGKNKKDEATKEMSWNACLGIRKQVTRVREDKAKAYLKLRKGGYIGHRQVTKGVNEVLLFTWNF